MTTKGKISEGDIDAVVQEFGFSSKTRSLKAFARNKDHKSINTAKEVAISAGIPFNDSLAFAAILENSRMNGAMVSTTAGISFYSVSYYYKALYNTPNALLHVYNNMKPTTLTRWSYAIIAIQHKFHKSYY